MKNITILLISFFIIACDRQELSDGSRLADVDSIVDRYRYAVQFDPEETIRKIKAHQETMDDSLYCHQLSAVMGIGYFMSNHVDSAFMMQRNILHFCQSQNQSDPNITKLYATAYNDMGVFYEVIGQQDSAIFYFQKAAEKVIHSENKESLPKIYINIADNYFRRGNYPEAANQYLKASFVCDSLNIDENINSIYNGLAQIYTFINNYKQADYYFNKIEPLFDTLPVYDQYFFANTRGNYYYNTKEYHKACSWFHKANRIASSFEQRSALATTEINLGEIYLLQNKPDSAKYFLDKAANYTFSTDDVSTSLQFYLNGLYAAYYLDINDLNKANKYLEIPYDTNSISNLHIYYNKKRLEELYQKQGNYKKAYELASEAKIYNDSIRNTTIQNQIAEIDLRHRQDTTILRRDISLAGQKQKVLQLQKTNTLIISIFVVFILAIITLFLYSRKRRELRHARQLTMITKLRMENIKNRISPHFMFNVLNSIIPTLREHEEFVRPTQLLVESIRGSLLVSEKIAITLEEEIKMVKNYIALLESINYEMPEITWNIAPDIDMETLVPSIVIQVPVENAIKYAFEEKKTDKQVSINMISKGGFLYIEVMDNGLGFDPKQITQKEKGAGSGLKILYKTIEMLNVVNQQKMDVKIQNEANISTEKSGTKVLIKIPLEYKYEL